MCEMTGFFEKNKPAVKIKQYEFLYSSPIFFFIANMHLLYSDEKRRELKPKFFLFYFPQ